MVSNDHMIRDAAIAQGAGVQSVASWMELSTKGSMVRFGRRGRSDTSPGFENRIPL